MSQTQRNLRTVSLVVYGLYFLSLVSGFTSIIGVIIAHIKKGDAAGTVYESHFANQIKIFWIGLVLGLVGGVLTLVVVGWLVLIAAGIWFLYRSIKGFLRAIDGRPYT
ncbi:DUF4870 family protein [Arenibaculum sp.]|uniref:DUF4870 family protein n=1 Tax=Arenibaculum sp. TaxID=2865862 RepID=UPI002E1282DA|nr:DUF4870 domain-containing protein [Arenibaculum sp.]